MNFEESEADFREADHRYAWLKRRSDAGSMSTEEFDGQRLRLMVWDDEDSWGVEVRTAGGPSYRIESGWVRRMSQVRDGRSPCSRREQGEQVAPQAIPDSSSTRERNGDVADSAAPVLESEEREALHETKRLGK